MKRILALLCLGVALATMPGVHPLRAADPPATEIIWHDVSSWGVEGQAGPHPNWRLATTRLPAKAEKIVRPPVWSLSRHSAGISFRFNTDAPTIQLRHTVGSAGLGMPHMPATG